jgi:hypothetical protein
MKNEHKVRYHEESALPEPFFIRLLLFFLMAGIIGGLVHLELFIG